MRPTLKARILEALARDGEIVSVFQFLCEIGYYNYANGLLTFRVLQSKGLIEMEKTTQRGHPWRVMKGDKWKTPVSGSVDLPAESQPLLPL